MTPVCSAEDDHGMQSIHDERNPRFLRDNHASENNPFFITPKVDINYSLELQVKAVFGSELKSCTLDVLL